MLTLLHLTICPHSRFVRLMLGEYGLSARFIEERFWERRENFLRINPAGTLPILIEEGQPPVPEAAVIAEYIDETRGADHGEARLMPVSVGHRVEVRRLTNWFNNRLFEEVTGPIINEREYRRHMTVEQGGGPPNSDVLRAARHNIRYHLAYIGWLVQTRDWLAGERLTYADLAAAAHLSSIDYLGEVPWTENEAARNWYARVKSRPSFRPILADLVAGLPPAPHYANLDF